jgi:hypothetical protein
MCKDRLQILVVIPEEYVNKSRLEHPENDASPAV